MLAVAVLGIGLVDPDLPVVAADDLGLTRGDGCFEGLRVRRGPDGPVIDKLDAHLARLHRSAAALDLPVDEVAWKDLLAEATEAWALAQPEAAEAAVKLMLTRGSPGSTLPGAQGELTGIVTVTEVGAAVLAARREGIRVVTLPRGLGSAAFEGAPWLLGGVKTLSYAINSAALREAERRGADDVVFVATDGALLEAPTASLVWVRSHALYTVAAGSNGILGGTTQRLLFDRAADAGWSTVEAAGTVDDLIAADTVLLVSSVRGPVGVTALDGHPLAPDSATVAELQRLAGF